MSFENNFNKYPEQENNKNKKIDKQTETRINEKGEGRRMYEVESLLEIAEQCVGNKSIISESAFEDLNDTIEQAKKENIDFKQIPNFEERINKVNELAPLVEIEGAIEKAKFFLEDGKDKQAFGAWYWDAKGKYDKYKGRLNKQDIERLEAELKNLYEEGIE